MKKRWLWIGAVVLLAFSLLFLPKTKFGAIAHWKRNLDRMEAFAMEQMIETDETDNYFGWKTDYVPQYDVVVFQIYYGGFASQTDERGIYYSPSDTASGLGNDMYSLPQENGTVFLGEGDNQTYVEKLADHW